MAAFEGERRLPQTLVRRSSVKQGARVSIPTTTVIKTVMIPGGDL